MPKRTNLQKLKPPLSRRQLKILYGQNPTPELARTLWEVERLKSRLEYFAARYLELMAMWPRDSGGRPVLLEILKSEMNKEVREEWPEPARELSPVNFVKGTIFEDILADEHPLDRALIADWERQNGGTLKD
ncbi:hypothetical protein [Herbaspirillum robiniae]|uniref:hypothetical protein n=1 Tax=Herbaspirillum robiniae TaxID=2014887 RepID=UPI0009A218FF|nr:hypothetical protein [Herbaspirillum robiniae]